MAGLACARRLHDAGLQVTVFDKSRGLGGRLATRRQAPQQRFDHGAQFATAQRDDFATYLRRAEATGAAAHWRPRGKPQGEPDWMVGLPGMSGLVQPLADSLDVRKQHHIGRWRQTDDGFQLATENGSVFTADSVISTLPPAQAVDLFHDEDVSQLLAGVHVAPCWAVMLSFQKPLSVPLDYLQPRDGMLSVAVRNNSKPGFNDIQDCWTLHATPDWSDRHLDDPPEIVARQLLDAFASGIDQKIPAPTALVAHRWRHARTLTPLGRPFASACGGRLLLGGDWCLGARVEFAWQSGVAMAEAILA